jgi:hypothetical protein
LNLEFRDYLGFGFLDLEFSGKLNKNKRKTL